MRKLLSIFLTFAKIGVLTFGGGLSMLPMLRREIVEKHGWATDDQLLDYYAVGQCTPGIIAVNTATFIGFYQAGILGGIIATLGVVFPSVVIILIVASVLQGFLDYPIVMSALSGIRAVVCALLGHTVISLAKKSLVDIFCIILFIATLPILFFTEVPSIVVIILCGIAGNIYCKLKEGKKQ